MALLAADLETVRSNLTRVQEEIAAACERVDRDPAGVRICVATKYVDIAGMEVLREAGVKIAAENRLQDMISKQEHFGDAFEWHFIGAIQSRKVREIAARVAMIHSLATESACERLEALDAPLPQLLVQVNVAGEASKQGVSPEQLDEFLALVPGGASGLMTMPPASEQPEDAREHFAALSQLVAERDLRELSIGTSQDYVVAVEEGATLVRLGSTLFRPTGK